VRGMACSHTHMAMAALAGTGLSIAAHLGASSSALVVLSSAGAGLLADADTPTSSISHAAGMLGRLPLALFRRASVRHRGVTHTLLAACVAGFGVCDLGWLPARWPLFVLVPALLAWLTMRSLLTFGSAELIRPVLSHRTRAWVGFLVACGVGVLGYQVSSKASDLALWLGLAVFTGWLTHLLLDCAMGGVPLLWPAVPSLSKRVALGHIKTEGVLDRLLGAAALAGVILLLWDHWHVVSAASALVHHLQI
jgi:membrane-bound metal-dependent hydrolase YbcI (DUF457 family)